MSTSPKEKAGVGLRAALAVEECCEPVAWRLQKLFAPQNRPFICYLFVVAAVAAFGVWYLADGNRLPGLAALLELPDLQVGRFFNREYIAKHLPAANGFWVVELAVVAVLWVLTRPLDLREHRWEKMGASVALVYLLLAGLSVPLSPTLAGRGENMIAFLSYCLPAVVFAAMWTPELVWHLARTFTLLVEPDCEQELMPTLRPAYRAARAGEFRRALRLARSVLLTDFRHYEALILMARLQRQLGRDWRARLTLHRALRNPDLMEGQRARILGMLRELDAGVYNGWLLVGSQK